MGPIPSSEGPVFMGGGLERGGGRLLLEYECSKAGLGSPKLVLQGHDVRPDGGDGSVETAGMLRQFSMALVVLCVGQFRRISRRRGLGR